MIFDRFWNFGDKSDEESDESADSDSYSTSTYQRKTSDDDWPYAYDEVDSIYMGDKEVLSEGFNKEDDVRSQEDEETYAGAWPRTIMGSRLTKPTDKTWLGYSEGSIQGLVPEGVQHDELFKHAGIFGQTGVGKSTLLKNMQLQWIMAGYGVCFFDVHGDDSIDLLQSIPEERLDDVIWIEPAGGYENEVGFNFFEPSSERGTIQYENEVEQIQKDFSELIKVSEGAKMGPVTETIVRQLVKADYNLTPIEFYRILQDEDERELLSKEFGDSFEQPALEQLSEYDKEDLDPVIRRIKSWVEKKQTRQVLARRESTVHIKDAIENNKIMLVNLANMNRDLQQVIGSTILRRIWNAIQDRKDIQKRNRTPYYLVLDEFGRLEHDKMPLDEMLAEARKYKLSLTVCTQHLEQIDKDEFRRAVKDQVSTFLSFNPTNDASKARAVAETIGRNVNEHDLTELPDYKVAGRLYDEEYDDYETALINSFAPFPPLRSETKARKEIKRSLERYGAPVKDEGSLDFDDYSLSSHLEGEDGSSISSDGEKKVIYTADNGDEIYQEQLLESLHTAEIRYDTVTINNKDWVRHSDLISELEKYIEGTTGYESIISNGIEKVSNKLIEQEQHSGETIYRLTADGEEKVFVQDTGSGGSGGNQKHRRHLTEAYNIFIKLGYDVRLPTQGGNEDMPDGLATPPIQPRNAQNREEQEQLEEQLKTEYPQIWKLFKDDMVAIESETTTPSRPAQALKNLSKALEQGRKCAFVVPDGNSLKRDPEDSDKDVEALARRLENILKDPPCVSSIDNEYKRYYNGNEQLSLKDGTFPVYRSDDGNGNIVWKEDLNSGRIILTRTKKDGDIAQFRNLTELKSPSGQKFEYRARQKSNGMWEVITGDDTNLDFVEEYNSKTQLEEDWSVISRPYIPREKFEQDLPPDHTWKIILIPEAGRDIEGPHLYEDGEITPLYEALGMEESSNVDTTDNSELLQTSKISETDTTSGDSNNDTTNNTTQDTNTDSAETTTEKGKNKDEEVKVADPDNPKSTNDVVKDSEDVWTKPEEGDDDYDPSKDNNNYRTGYNEDHVSDDWTGGLARENDQNDFDNYTIPPEKSSSDKEQKQEKGEKSDVTEDLREFEKDSKTKSENQNHKENEIPDSYDEEELSSIVDEAEQTITEKMEQTSDKPTTENISREQTDEPETDNTQETESNESDNQDEPNNEETDEDNEDNKDDYTDEVNQLFSDL